MSENKNNWGGKRKGAGRPKSKKIDYVALMISKELRNALKQFKNEKEFNTWDSCLLYLVANSKIDISKYY